MNGREATAFLALGSNLGDRLGTLESAIETLRQTSGLTVQRVSTVLETPPFGLANGDGGGLYLNAIVMVKTDLEPLELLEVCLSIEKSHGRDRAMERRWGPRRLDIDVILYGDLVVEVAGRLRIPHPRMAERMFVLKPLAEIASEVVHPVLGVDISTLLMRLECTDGGRDLSCCPSRTAHSPIKK